MKTECAAVEKKLSPAQVLLSWFPTISPQGDGSVIVRPGKPVAEMTVTQAARYLGVHKSSVYRLIDQGDLVARRPLRKKTLIPAGALEEWRKKTSDPEYWEGRN